MAGGKHASHMEYDVLSQRVAKCCYKICVYRAQRSSIQLTVQRSSAHTNIRGGCRPHLRLALIGRSRSGKGPRI